MFGLDELKKTRYFQEAAKVAREEGRQEGRREVVYKLLEFGLSAEQVAEALSLLVEEVRLIAARST